MITIQFCGHFKSPEKVGGNIMQSLYPLTHNQSQTNGSETITITLSKKQLLGGVQKTVYPRCCLPSQAMYGITKRLWDYLVGLTTDVNNRCTEKGDNI